MVPERITVHCSASPKGVYLKAYQLRKMHTDPPPYGNGWSDIGYHFVIRTDGVVEKGRPLNVQGAHVYGHNKNNVGICLIGGLDNHGKPASTYSKEQYHTLYALIFELCKQHQISFQDVCGHRDYSKDLNGDGKITSEEFIKECPCFDVRHWFKQRLEYNGVIYEYL